MPTLVILSSPVVFGLLNTFGILYPTMGQQVSLLDSIMFILLFFALFKLVQEMLFLELVFSANELEPFTGPPSPSNALT